jgi:nicotinamidase-related amidase
MADFRADHRAPLRLRSSESAVLLVDVQEKLTPKILGIGALLERCGTLIRGATILKVPVIATEQYPRGLGPTLPELAGLLAEPILDKTSFSCCGDPRLLDRLSSLGVRRIVLAGIETHVCALQTALDLLAAGFIVHVAVDAVSSRFRVDRDAGLTRLQQAGCVVTTVESALFEWADDATHPGFKALSALIRERDPLRGEIG